MQPTPSGGDQTSGPAVVEEVIITEETLVGEPGLTPGPPSIRVFVPQPAAGSVSALGLALPGAEQEPSHAATVDHTTPVPHAGRVQAVLLGAFWLDSLLYTIVVPFLPGRAQQLGASPLVTSALFASYSAGLILTTLPASWLTDRVGARRTLLAGLIALFATTVLFPFAQNLLQLFAARAAQGAAGAVTWTAGLALIAQLYDADARPAILARIFIVTGIGTLIGPPLGGALYAWGGFRAPFLLTGALVLADGIGRIVFLPSRSAVKQVQVEPGATRALLRSGRFVTALIATVAGAAFFSLLEPTMPPLLAGQFGVRPLEIGAIFGAITAVFTIVQPFVAFATRRIGAPLTMVFGLAVGALSLMLIAVGSTLPEVLLGLIKAAFGVALIMVPALEVLTQAGAGHASRSTDNVSYGAIFGAYNLAYAVGMLTGPLLAGAAITWAGSLDGLALVSILMVLLALVVLRQARAVKRRRRQRGPRVGHRAGSSRGPKG
jgi:DHA1 family solute carrier family 18 vesicular amine transporter 1/2